MPDRPADKPVYNRVLLKISGEGFCPEGGFGIEGEELEEIARECVDVCKSGVQLAVVVGGGNFIRGATFSAEGNIPRATADYMGMLATVLNAVALQETMEKMGQPTRVMSAISVYSVCEPFLRRRAVRHLEKGRAIILAVISGSVTIGDEELSLGETCLVPAALTDVVIKPIGQAVLLSAYLP